MLLSRTLEGGSYAVLALVGPVLANASASQRHLPIAFALTAAWIPNGQIAAGLLSGLFIAQATWKPLWLIGIGATCALGAWTFYLLKRDRLNSGSTFRPDSGAAPLTRFQRRALMIAAATFMLWSTQYFAFMTWLPTFLVEVHGVNQATAVQGYLVPVATLLVFVYVAGFLLRVGLPIMPLLAATLFLQASVWLLVPLVEGEAAGIALLVLWGAGAGITPTCLFGLPTTIATDPGQRPQAFGIVLTGRNLGVLTGPLLLGGILTLTADWALASPLFAAVTVMATGFAVALIKLR
jgi:predicted MFS family arabinose efflux permease